jgi:Tol biopolymer transport system component
MRPSFYDPELKYRLSIFDVETEQLRPILVTDRLIEAPNWHPDGTVIVNCEGHLFQINPNDPKLTAISIENLEDLNNDHGITPDGRSLIVSDSPDTGSSIIYIVPYSGGRPSQVTDASPSWWHGISPDGATLVYTARRNGVFDIYNCPFDGGIEKRLTDGFDHTDGPDYTADGAWIWFNGSRHGSMDLWRMRPDGTNLERMTSGASVDWFPHPSPDGKTVLYLAYEEGTEGHPRNHNVELRLLRLKDGSETCLAQIFGGQGTINVPCWEPNSSRFAFVDVLKVGLLA